MTDAVQEIVHKQLEPGVDIVTERLTGFDGQSRFTCRMPMEAADFPDYYQTLMSTAWTVQRPVCTGPITWRGEAHVQRDIDYLSNEYYPTDEA